MGIKILYKSGEVFNGITFIKEVNHLRNRRALWKCICGKEFECRIARIKAGKTKSCGCLQRKIISDLKTTHGQYNTRLYTIWRNMLQRCNNEKHSSYKRYGGRGVKVCKEWTDFNMFFNWAMENGYQDNLTLDRKDGNQDYNSSNCRFTTWLVQRNNRT